MPSVHDGFGAAHIEAMAAGLPTIGGAGTGAEDIARAGEGALLVRAGDVPRLVEVLDRPAERPGRARAPRRGRPPHGRRALHLGALRGGDPGRLPNPSCRGQARVAARPEIELGRSSSHHRTRWTGDSAIFIGMTWSA